MDHAVSQRDFLGAFHSRHFHQASFVSTRAGSSSACLMIFRIVYFLSFLCFFFLKKQLLPSICRLLMMRQLSLLILKTGNIFSKNYFLSYSQNYKGVNYQAIFLFPNDGKKMKPKCDFKLE